MSCKYTYVAVEKGYLIQNVFIFNGKDRETVSGNVLVDGNVPENIGLLAKPEKLLLIIKDGKMY